MSLLQRPIVASRRTVLLAPARVLKRVAVTTRLFLGSTAPTAISVVSTTATSFGGAVRTAARPNLTANADPETGVPVLGDGLAGVIGVCGEVTPTLSDNLPFRLRPEVEVPRGDRTLPATESLRCGVASEEVERARIGEMPGRVLGLRILGVRGDTGREGSAKVPTAVAGCVDSSSSVHWR